MNSETVAQQNSIASEKLKSRPRETSRSQSRRQKQRALSPRQASYDTILWRLNSQQPSGKTMVVGLTGCQSRMGATTIAANIALRAGVQLAQPVLLIDANWHSPSLQKVFRVSRSPGLLDILSGDHSPRECDLESVGENVDLLPIGSATETSSMKIQSQMVAEMLEHFRAEYQLVIVDLPVAEKLGKSLPLARELDAVLLVTQCESTKRQEAQRTLQRLEQDGITVSGTLLNRHRDYVPRWLRRWL